jgi:hypothetical protein
MIVETERRKEGNGFNPETKIYGIFLVFESGDEQILFTKNEARVVSLRCWSITRGTGGGRTVKQLK